MEHEIKAQNNKINGGSNVINQKGADSESEKKHYIPPTINVFVAEEVTEGGGPNVYESQEGGGYFS